MYELTETEIQTFRTEYQEKEKEIQRYIGVYLSGLVLVTGWIIGPQSAPVIKMVLGNNGYNVYGVMVIVSLNVLFTCFLLYKSLIVHEINQFLTYQTGETGYRFWESWRRSRYSATKFARPIYSFLLAILPITASFILLYGLWLFLNSDSQILVDELARVNTAPAVTDAEPKPAAQIDPRALAEVIWTARSWFWAVVALHLLPLLFLYLNWFPNDHRWAKINKLRAANIGYEDLDGIDRPPPDSLPDHDPAGLLGDPQLSEDADGPCKPLRK